MTVGCVLLTTGNKPEELRRAVGSLLRQEGVEVDVAVVGNGWAPEGLPDGVHAVHVPVDEGIPAGRNAGIPAVRGDLVFFLDDDAQLRDTDALARVAAELDRHPDIGMVQLRVDPADPAATPLRDWTPRLRVGDRTRSSDVTAVWEGAVGVRRAVLDRVGGWPEAFRYVHEGVDLAWRVMGAGWRVRYLGDVVALHPVTGAAPHWYSYAYSLRNRVFLARRHLPAWLGVLFVALFALRSVPRLARGGAPAWRAAADGLRRGLREDAGPRRPLPVNTLWRMTLAGRPPLL